MNTLNNLIGATILRITNAQKGAERVVILTDRGTLHMFHEQDCCECVEVEDVTGNPSDLLGGIVSVAEERSNEEDDDHYEHVTWTFYEIRTTKGDITIRWCGRSNGYYSEAVDLRWLPKE